MRSPLIETMFKIKDYDTQINENLTDSNISCEDGLNIDELKITLQNKFDFLNIGIQSVGQHKIVPLVMNILQHVNEIRQQSNLTLADLLRLNEVLAKTQLLLMQPTNERILEYAMLADNVMGRPFRWKQFAGGILILLGGVMLILACLPAISAVISLVTAGLFLLVSGASVIYYFRCKGLANSMLVFKTEIVAQRRKIVLLNPNRFAWVLPGRSTEPYNIPTP